MRSEDVMRSILRGGHTRIDQEWPVASVMESIFNEEIDIEEVIASLRKLIGNSLKENIEIGPDPDWDYDDVNSDAV